MPAELAPHALALPTAGDPEVAATLMAATIDALARGAPVEGPARPARAGQPPADANRVRLLQLAARPSSSPPTAPAPSSTFAEAALTATPSFARTAT